MATWSSNLLIIMFEVTEDELICIQFVKSEYMRTILPFELGKQQQKVAKVICFHVSKRFFSNWPVIRSLI